MLKRGLKSKLFALFSVTKKKNSVNMENLKFRSLIILALFSFLSVNIIAQSTDDLYYTPSFNDYSVEEVQEVETVSAVSNDVDYNVSDSRLDNDYYYQSRIKRFCNPTNGVSYYAPAYTNSYYYNNNAYAWSNNIYNQPFYSQRWWVPSNNWSNNGYYNNRNYSAPFNSFGSTVYRNNSYYSNPYYGSAYNYNNTGGYIGGRSYDPCISPNYVSNNFDNYVENRRTETRSNANVRTQRDNAPSATSNNNPTKTTRSFSGSSRSDRSATRSNNSFQNKATSTTNTKSNIRIERNDNQQKTKRNNGIRNAFKNLGNSSKDTNRSRTYKPSSSGSKSYSSGRSSGSSRSSGTSGRGGRR